MPYFSKKNQKQLGVLLIAMSLCFSHYTFAQSRVAAPIKKIEPVSNFSENPIVYFLITDRFLNANPNNDHSYGRKSDGLKEIGTFHGGDLAGITQKLKEGYFKKLGVNALWITAPYEQIHGWVVGGKAEFQHYAYHGYFALDYTNLDANMGTPDELKTLMQTAHQQGIRVLFDVVMNHPGYGDLQTLNEYKTEVLRGDWQNATLKNYHDHIDYQSPAWDNWWGGDWVRAGLGNYPKAGGSTDLTMQLDYLPDFRTEVTKAVKLPAFFQYKKDTRAKDLPNASVREYLVTWLSDWVREYGVDGFRCDTAKHVDLASWALLKQRSQEALREWKAENPNEKIDDAPFWMVGEVFPHGVNKDAYFTQGGFDALLNFSFQDQADSDYPALDKIYTEYAEKLHAESFDVLSYISSHDTKLFNRQKLIQAGTALLLAPGGVQIFYGDESARPIGAFSRSDKLQATRSDMNWDSQDLAVLAHWQLLGQFRLAHPAIARGTHQLISSAPYTFSRSNSTDQVVVALGLGAEQQTIIVSKVFAEGSQVRNVATGEISRVKEGMVKTKPNAQGLVLLELLVK